jgi:hypothetical protein
MAAPGLPVANAILVNAQLFGNLALEKAKVEPALSQMVPEGSPQLIDPLSEPAIRQDSERHGNSGTLAI